MNGEPERIAKMESGWWIGFEDTTCDIGPLEITAGSSSPLYRNSA